LREAEAVYAFLKGENLGLIEAVKLGLLNRPKATSSVSFADGLKQFLEERKPHLSVAQWQNYRVRGGSFELHVGAERMISAISSIDVDVWLKSKGPKGQSLARRTWNGYRGDLSAIFNWFIKAPRKWIDTNPVDSVEKFANRALRTRNRQALPVTTCRELMAFVEANHPDLVTYFVLTLFLGIRPDMKNGEAAELARCVARDGVGQYFKADSLHLPGEVTKDGRDRRIDLMPNVRAWLERYPPTPASICPGDTDVYRAIRQRFQIPHDGLRHAAISAFVAMNDSLAGAALAFGNSEGIIRRHYLNFVTKEEAREFYQIQSTKVVSGASGCYGSL
jgi:hypothetical protein